MVRRLLPQPLRLRLWLLRNHFTPYSRQHRRAQPSRLQQLRYRRVLAGRVEALRTAEHPFGLDRLAEVLVINLGSRPDRLAEVAEEMGRLGIAYERHDAIADADPKVGCTLSHVASVERMLASATGPTMICEDDVRFLAGREELDALVEAFLDDAEAEVACLAYFLHRSEPHDALFLRGTAIQTASCYVVKPSIAPELAELWREGAEQLRAGGDPHRVAADRIWFRLQERHVFLVPMERAAQQASGYSDLESRAVTRSH
ncbi:MAG: glycosyl transferase, family 25 [Gaiellaceae bacterium]|nr:glycosyl transferase, family 25 [Gaiellaceae bacterium]